MITRRTAVHTASGNGTKMWRSSRTGAKGDYAEVAISAIYENGGHVLKLIGDGILAIFAMAPADEAWRPCPQADWRRHPGDFRHGPRR